MNDMPTDSSLSDKEELTRSRISFVASGALLTIFAASYGYLEYYYIQDPVQGKTENLTVREGSDRVAAPLISGLYSYHIYISNHSDLHSGSLYTIF
jgi:hypothetical protein